MSKKRIEFQKELESILGSRNVYFQEPSNITMKYPCIIYKREDITTKSANNAKYISHNRYSVTCISKSPTSDISEKILNNFKYSEFDRSYSVEGLNHVVLTIYY